MMALLEVIGVVHHLREIRVSVDAQDNLNLRRDGPRGHPWAGEHGPLNDEEA